MEPDLPADDTAANLESAQTALLQSVKGRSRDVLEAKIRLVRNQRDAAVHSEAARISQEFAAKGSFNSGARLHACWNKAVEQTRTATATLLTECLSLGAPESAIVSFLAADARHFLKATSQGWVIQQQGGNPGHSLRLIQEYAANAAAHAAGIPDLVKSRQHDFEQDKGTRLERKLKALARRPAVTIGAFAWLVITSVWGHVEMFRAGWSLVAKLWTR
jgi:hypothetical protein